MLDTLDYFDLTIPRLRLPLKIHRQEKEIHVHRLFVAPLFVTAKVRRQPEYSSVAECSNMEWLLHTTDYNLGVSAGNTSNRKNCQGVVSRVY